MIAAIRLSAVVFAIGGILILILGLPIGWMLARVRGRIWAVIEVIVLLPLVLPPTVLGYYLMNLIGRNGILERMFGLNLMFTPMAVILAATTVGLPLMIQSTRAAVASVDPVFIDTARVLGAGEWRIFLTITLPLARRGILAGWILGLTRALGEFGATLMVAGNIPGKTQTMPLAIYEAILAGRKDQAFFLVSVMTMVALFGLLAVRFLESPAITVRTTS